MGQGLLWGALSRRSDVNWALLLLLLSNLFGIGDTLASVIKVTGNIAINQNPQRRVLSNEINLWNKVEWLIENETITL